MIKAMARGKDGRIILVLGLSDGNIARLQAGEPIYFDIRTMQMSRTDRLGGVTVFYGPDEAALVTTLRDLIGPETEVIVVPRGDARPQ